MPAAHEIHGLQMGETGGAEFAAVGFVAAVTHQINAELAFGGFDLYSLRYKV
jgi:hypothetical protein